VDRVQASAAHHGEVMTTATTMRLLLLLLLLRASVVVAMQRMRRGAGESRLIALLSGTQVTSWTVASQVDSHLISSVDLCSRLPPSPDVTRQHHFTQLCSKYASFAHYPNLRLLFS